MLELFRDANALWVLAGTTLLGISSGVLGSFAFLRKRGLMGDVLAHSALPGICLAFLFTGSKNPLWLLIGATLTGLLASLFLSWITRFSKIKEDTALGLVLSTFFGFGIVLLTQIQHSDFGNQAGLDKFLFGQSASLVGTDVVMMGSIAFILILLVSLFFKELKLLCFDANYGKSLGFPMVGLDFFLMLLLVVAVVIGLQAAGVVLMASLLITPAATARYWTERLDHMIIISACIGALSGLVGTILSSVATKLSTGPLIVLAVTILFFISMFCAPKRGLIAKWLRLIQTRQKVRQEQIYQAWNQLGTQTTTLTALSEQSNLSPAQIRRWLNQKKRGGQVVEGSPDTFTLSSTSWKEASDTALLGLYMEMWHMYEDIETDCSIQDIEQLSDLPESLRAQLQYYLQKHISEEDQAKTYHSMKKVGIEL
ncbi:metal ABC transporter permease [Baia soyae]|uniref:Manganese transport system membrane protein MntC n=1 Tax=Baia soyae TaxID=1544746 RepID=A0A4R2RS34_9BACL|nr:metal ABC transporter permease [Baia soyae]TCP65649.1 manganese/zinc/iron transport system permease protein [Baia soyae]